MVVQRSNVQDLAGVSQTTGVVYHGQSANSGTVIQGKVGSETTTDVFMLISQGAPMVAVQGVGHMTVNPDGTVTATFNISNVRCT